MGVPMPDVTRRFLVIDHNPDSGELLIRALKRKFPLATVLHTVDAEDAVNTVQSIAVDAVVVHRGYDADAVAIVKNIRAINPQVPIIVVSGIDRSEAVLAAGATGFLNFDSWLLLGSTVANALGVVPASRT
jgi:DNA-binding NarL/FixJ family response regulator